MPTLAVITLFVVRTSLEDRTLHAELSGYEAYAAYLTLVVSRTILRALKKKMPDQIDRLPTQRWAGIFASISQELLLLAMQPPRLTEGTERLVTAMILNEAIDPDANRPTLIKSVETRCHV